MIQNTAYLEDAPSFSKILSSIFNAFANLPIGIKDASMVNTPLQNSRSIPIVNHLQPILPNTLFLMCASVDDNDEMFNNLKSVANGYVVKIDNSENIVAHIKDAIYDGALFSSGIDIQISKPIATIPKEDTNLHELTTKENEILAELAKGLLYKEIAAQHKIMLDTVKKHCGNIYRKLEVANKTEAINIYLGRN